MARDPARALSSLHASFGYRRPHAASVTQLLNNQAADRLILTNVLEAGEAFAAALLNPKVHFPMRTPPIAYPKALNDSAKGCGDQPVLQTHHLKNQIHSMQRVGHLSGLGFWEIMKPGVLEPRGSKQSVLKTEVLEPGVLKPRVREQRISPRG